MELSAEPPRASSSCTSSPEFEFWMVGKNPSTCQTDFLTADELFVDGVVLPLDLLSLSIPSQGCVSHCLSEPGTNVQPPSAPSSSLGSAPPASHSNKWKDLIKAGEKALEEIRKRRNRIRGGTGGSAKSRNGIWPFNSSHSSASTGTGSWGRAKAAVTRRRASGEPCSRSNSRGLSSEPLPATTSSSSRWPLSSGRMRSAGGFHLSRTNPVWKLRGKTAKTLHEKEANVSSGIKDRTGDGDAGFGTRNSSVDMGCEVDHPNTRPSGGDGGSSGGGSSSVILILRTMFSKKVQ
ncbi:uncharacterized protein LOC103994876 [Musa acuminata AAA Group]|uniref:(wild Malaysian banana) hypothetical protein n=1 Tax=Musa acuminata subsp. malaccensis TaxID=214687 RepID=A0A804K820_MUSAM|nr:PREDICTED: uncharacterized protein LOC103994876 [Musa acuminata subsp. malaccensis]CAG1831776.1 unnamed protein product [Musa acuminata subsp. malaccensis]